MSDTALIRPGDEERPTVSICIPHYQVKGLLQLCLRALRRYTDRPSYEVIVVDNGSRDESLDWLRSLDWITLVERGTSTPENWILAMNTALDIGLERARGSYYLIMHSDTIVKRSGWLARLVEALESGPRVAAAGSGKLEQRGRLARILKEATDTKKFRLWLRRTLGGDREARQLRRDLCPRDYCALYRADVLREHGLSFVGKGGYSAGETMFYDLRERGYESAIVPVGEMMELMDHIAHATGAILPERELKHSHMLRKTRKRLGRLYHRDDVEALLSDESLER